MNQNEKIFPQLDPKQEAALNRKLHELPASEEEWEDEIMDEEPVRQLPPKRATIQTPAQRIVQPSSQRNLKSEIEEIERELGEGPITAPKRDAATFLDNMGNETFYVKNIGGRHIIITYIAGMDKIPVGTSVDLLQSADLDVLKKSRDLRRYLQSSGPGRELERLTEEEYFEEIKKMRDNRRKVGAMKRQEDHRANTRPRERELMPHERPFEPQERPIRPVILSKLGKLALKYDKDPEHARLAMTSREFIIWAQNEPLTHADIEYIMGDPSVVKDHNIRAALLEKKANTPSSEEGS